MLLLLSLLNWHGGSDSTSPWVVPLEGVGITTLLSLTMRSGGLRLATISVSILFTSVSLTSFLGTTSLVLASITPGCRT